MRQVINSILLTVLMSMVGAKVFAFTYDIAVENADGITIYYNYSIDGKELKVTRGNYKYRGNIVIPEDVTYKNRTRKVTSVSRDAFIESRDLISVTIPNSVTYIEDYAFAHCYNLTSVTLSNSLKSIGNGLFYDDFYLTLTIPNSVTSIGDLAFYYCLSLGSVIIPNSVTSIGKEAFWLSYLTSITIPNSVTSIGEGAFRDCSFLSSVIIPNSVTNISEYAFYDCTGLTSITIPNSVTNIGEKAFEGCKGLTSITIPNSVKSIGKAAFRGCSGLASVVSLIEEPFPLNDFYRTFSLDVFNNVTLYVPVGTIDKYKSTFGWKDFLYIEEGTGPNGGDITNIVSDVRARTVLIQSNDNQLTISGANEGATINVFDLSGKPVGSAKASSETTSINTTLRSGDIGIVKIGEKAIKVLIK